VGALVDARDDTGGREETVASIGKGEARGGDGAALRAEETASNWSKEIPEI
jgi:hypothetical protein